MEFKIGDLVTRKSYNNDLIFKISQIEEDIYYLTGVNIRLCADSNKADLVKYEEEAPRDEDFIKEINVLERCDYFYLPGKILLIVILNI